MIGREDQLRALEQRLLDSDVRLLSLVGPGGVGKTRLALSLMHRVAARFADGAVFVDLSLVHEAAQVVPTLAYAVGARETRGQPGLHVLLEALAGRQLLLVVDNFEHVLAAAPALSELLGSNPHVKALATSREPLDLRWEHVHWVPPLDLPEVDDAESVERAPAVRLFVERAQAADATFALTDANAQTVAALCARLDGLPLALELAAARVRGLPPRVLLEHLDGRLDLLVGRRDAPARHQSLRATLDWSYELLAGPEQRLLRSIGVFVGGCRLEDVQAVAARAAGAVSAETGDVLGGLAALVERSLLRREEDTLDGTPRYRLLETVRAYALERLRAEREFASAGGAHAQHYLAVAEDAAPLLIGSAQTRWLDHLEADHDNLRAALRWFLDAPQREEGLRLAVALTAFWSTRGHFVEGRTWLEAFLPGDGSSTSTPLTVRALDCAGQLAGFNHDYVPAQRLYALALDGARKARDPASIAAALRGLGEIALALENAPSARAYLTEGLALSRTHALDLELAETLLVDSELAMHELTFAHARGALEEALDVFRRLDHPRGVGRAQVGLGLVAMGDGDHSEAADWLTRSLDVFASINDPGWLTGATRYLGVALLGCGDMLRARAVLDQSVSIAREQHDTHGLAQAFEGLACLAARQGHTARVRRLLRYAAELHAQCGVALTGWERQWLEAWLPGMLADAPPVARQSTTTPQRMVDYALRDD